MLSLETIITRLIFALLIGGVIGAEREYHNKSAGLRTLTLICLGSTLFTLVSILLSNGTTDRIASNIVTGIGFIGAGVIFKSDKGVNGITTAASIWITAALGMAIGAGLYVTAAIGCIIVFMILSVFTWVEKLVDNMNQEHEYKIVTSYQPDVFIPYERMMKENGLKFKRDKSTKIENDITGNWKVSGSKKNHERFIKTMLQDNSIKKFDF
ncbi:MAG: MgtC/SapB family protein [Bacteroidota bacterium]|nr:MgtC/SapB family protein [Bacteroidota bacterium]